MFLLAGCKNERSEQETSKTINVPLHSRTYPSPFIGWINSMYYQDDPKKQFSIPVHGDSVVMFFDAVDPRGFKKVLAKKKKLGDTVIYDKQKSSIRVLTGLDGENQFYIIDQNRNNSFGDDKKYVFPAILGDSTHNDIGLRFNFGKVTMPSIGVLDSILINDTINFSIIPDNYYVKLGENKEINWLKKDKLFLKLMRYDYLFGTFNVNAKPFKVAVNKFGGIFGYHEILIEEEDKEFKKPGDAERQVLKLKDTVELQGSYYVIDKIVDNPISIVLQQLDYVKPMFGNRKGDTMRDFRVKDLYGDSTNLKSLMSDKKFMLLDFWGTWCGPCKALTPNLVQLHNEINDKVSFVSLAYQLDTLPIIQYVKDNNMEWNHVFIEGKPKSGIKNYPKILKELNVLGFPTFILLDKDLEIIFRGSGSNFQEMEELIKGL